MTKALIAVLFTLLALSLAGCVTPAGTSGATSAPQPLDAPGDRPADWIGRWHAPSGRFIQIMPTARSGYFELTLGDAAGHETNMAALASDGRLYFTRAGEALALRPGNGAETGVAALAGRRLCLIVVPGPEGYCRTPDTADALPLTTGAYAPVSQDCWEPTPADLVYFDGQILTTPAAPRCATPLLDHTGVIFSLGSQCTTTAGATAPPASATARVTVVDDKRFALDDAQGDTALYQYCPTSHLPTALRLRSR
ncbi:hypothetical protein [Salinisphaera aquimarina]|uniref:Lipoprotein n=1 Tax=Salinisphaera aquimarina TaxID=2094031 RepID=A0ABV7EN82_9GAMM